MLEDYLAVHCAKSRRLQTRFLSVGAPAREHEVAHLKVAAMFLGFDLRAETVEIIGGVLRKLF